MLEECTIWGQEEMIASQNLEKIRSATQHQVWEEHSRGETQQRYQGQGSPAAVQRYRREEVYPVRFMMEVELLGVLGEQFLLLREKVHIKLRKCLAGKTSAAL